MAAKWGVLSVPAILVWLMAPVWADVWYVDNANTSGVEDGVSWATAFVTIQEGIDAAGSGDQVWVKQGIYDEARSSFPDIPDIPAMDTGSLVMKDGVDLYGGFAGTEASPEERADGARSTVDGSKSLNGRPASTVAIAASARIDGFELTGGVHTWRIRLATALHSAGPSPTVENCVFRDNDSTSSVVFFHSGGDLRIRECQFLDNTSRSAGLYCLDAPTVMIDDCLFRAEGDPGLEAACVWACGAVSLSDCTFENNHKGLTLGNCGSVSLSGSEWSNSGRALHCWDGEIEIAECVFDGNQSPYPQYAILDLRSCDAEIRACQLLNNVADSVIVGEHCDIAISNSRISDSEAYYLVRGYAGKLHIEDSAFVDNTGEVILNEIAEVHLTRTVFEDISRVFLNQCDSVIDSCLISGYGQTGGVSMVVDLMFSDVLIRDTTIVKHAESPEGEALVLAGGSRLSMVNSIVWASDASGIGKRGVNQAVVQYSNVKGGHSGPGNLNSDPLFLDPAARDYRLSWDSPCVNAGDPNTLPTVDLLGVPRPQLGVPDMGAYERMLNDEDGDGMDDGWELLNALNPDDGSDGVLDLDEDGVSNRDEFWLRTGVNDPNDPASHLYVAATGDDVSGEGSETAPWATIARAMDSAKAYSAFRAVTVHVGAGDFDGPVVFAENATLEGAGPSATTIHYLNLADNEHVTVTGAEGALLKNCKVAQPGYLSVPTVLLRIDGVAMEVENVTFDGNDNLYSLGAMISDIGSSDAEIRDCVFRRLYNGIQAVNSGVNIVRNQFESIREDAVFVRLPDARKAYDPIVTPLLGDASRALTTGNNQFRSVFGSFVFSMSPDTTKAENNDWGIYDRKQIAAKMQGAVDFEPFYGSEDRPAGCRGGAGRIAAGDAGLLLLTGCALALAVRRRARG